MDDRSAIKDQLVKGRERKNKALSLQKKNYANHAQLALDLVLRDVDYVTHCSRDGFSTTRFTKFQPW